MRLRSLLFVPGDRPERFAKAVASRADAVILDLEDSVAPERKAFARDAVREALSEGHWFVRVNPLDSPYHADDIAVLADTRAAAIVLPKAEGAGCVRALVARLPRPVLPIATETPAAIFGLGSYRGVAEHLVGMTWGAEDLPAAIGAATARDDDGRYTAPYELARSLTLFGAHAAGVAAIETVFPDIRDAGGLAAYAQRGARDGFTGMMAIHPAQVAVIAAAFTPTPDQVTRAEAIVAAFAADPGAGVLMIDGRMMDAPHLKAARALLAGRDPIG